MNETLAIASGFSLPLDAATRRLAILAMSGAGKSNAAVVMAEEMYRAGIQWVAIDPKGDWWGIRSGKDGSSAGLSVPIFGGLHGDIQIEATLQSGRHLASVIIDLRLTCVVDVSEMTNRQEMWAFLSGFGEELLHRNREALHVFLEEADEILPQTAKEKGNLPRCLGVWQRLVKRGRFRGIGSTQITQRSAALNKDTLYQAEALIAMRVTGEGDRKTIRGWVDYHNGAEEVIGSLPKLADGEGWIISPAWLKQTKRIQFRRRSTFDSGSTPVLIGSGSRQHNTKLADIDMAVLQKQMSDAIERAKADDPEELRREITALRAALAAKAKTIQRTDLQPLIDDAVKNALQEQAHSIALHQHEFLQELASLVGRFVNGASMQEIAIDPLSASRLSSSGSKPPTPAACEERREDRKDCLRSETVNSHGKPSGGVQRMMIALAQRGGLSNRQLGLRSGLSSKSGTFATYLSRLRKDGYIEGTSIAMTLTNKGREALGHYDPLPTGRELLVYWQNELGSGSGAARILDALASSYPKPLTNEQLGRIAGISHKSGTFATYLSRLRGLELITGSRGELRISEELID